MILAVAAPLQQKCFLATLAAHGGPTACTMGASFEAFGRKPASGWGFYINGEGEAAFSLAVRGTTAYLLGQPDTEELALFLRLQGVNALQCEVPLPSWPLAKQAIYFYLPAFEQLPALPPVEGFCLNRQPSIMQVVTFLNRGGQISRQGEGALDGFYGQACAKCNRGLAKIWAVEQQGTVVATAGAYSIHGGWAYLAAVETEGSHRRKGLGRWLTVSLANHLTGQGHNVTLLCEEKNIGFYTAMGFVKKGAVLRYTVPAAHT